MGRVEGVDIRQSYGHAQGSTPGYAAADRPADHLGKKRLTRKNTLIADPARYIHYLRPTTCGATHNYRMLKNELDVNPGLLDLFTWLADLSYLGLVRD